MKFFRVQLMTVVFVFLSVMLVACGGGPGSVSFNIEGQDILYDNTSLTAQVGQEVTVTLENVGALEHSFLIDELGVDSGSVAAGASGTVTFTPSTAGTFTFYCNIPGHSDAGMVGELTVSQ